MNEHPTKIERVGDNRLSITWSDDVATEYTFRQLREACPCASCREKHGPKPPQPANLLTVLKPAEAQPLKITGMEPVGNYAYCIQFSDGHDTGIYTLSMLRDLGTPESERPA